MGFSGKEDFTNQAKQLLKDSNEDIELELVIKVANRLQLLLK